MRDVIVFDFDGVLADTLQDMLDAAKTVCAAMGNPCEPSPADLNALDQMSFAEFGRQLGVPAGRLTEFVERTFRLFVSRPSPPPIFPGMRQVILRLAQTCRIGILSGNTSAVVTRFLEQYELAASVAQVFTEEVPGNRADKLARLIALLGDHGDQAYMVGDAVSDIRAARQASALSVAVTWGHQSEEKLRRLHPNYLVHNPGELLGIWINRKESGNHPSLAGLT